MCVCARARARVCAMMYEYVSILDEPALCVWLCDEDASGKPAGM